MLVYRLCKFEEVNKLLEEKNIDSIGVPASVFINIQQVKNVSSHEYDYHLDYLHFFKDLSSIFYYDTEDKYLCTYNIADEILTNHKGQGFYLDFVNLRRLVAVDEFAIPTNELSFENVVKVEKIKEFIDYDDYIADSSLDDELKLIYKRKERSRTRKISWIKNK